MPKSKSKPKTNPKHQDRSVMQVTLSSLSMSMSIKNEMSAPLGSTFERVFTDRGHFLYPDSSWSNG